MDRDLSNSTKEVLRRIERARSSYGKSDFFYGKTTTKVLLREGQAIEKVLRSCFTLVQKEGRTVRVYFNGITRQQLQEMKASFSRLNRVLHHILNRFYKGATDLEFGMGRDDHKNMLIRMCDATKEINKLLSVCLWPQRRKIQYIGQFVSDGTHVGTTQSMGAGKREGVTEGEEESKGHEGSP